MSFFMDRILKNIKKTLKTRWKRLLPKTKNMAMTQNLLMVTVKKLKLTILYSKI